MKKFLSVPIDWLLLAIPLILTAIGIITIYTITFTENQATLAIDQAVSAGLGIVAMVVLMFSDYRGLGTISKFLYAFGLLILIPLLPILAPKLPFVLKIYGAYRWLDFGFFQIQPAEIFKLVAAIVGARFLADKIGLLGWKKVVGYAFFGGIPTALILIQPDLGTASVVFVIFLAIFLAARPSVKTLAIVGAGLLIGVILVWANLQGYQKERLETFLNPGADPQGQGYNVQQALIAVGSGGLMGRGFGQGSQTILNFLPVPHADFIFAGFAEATGFVGSIVLLVLYVVLLLRIVAVARASNDPFGQLVAIGLGAKILFQTTVHIGMNVGLLPVTGIPLPFMSYGGTALVIDLAGIGLLQSIYIRHKKAFFHAG